MQKIENLCGILCKILIKEKFSCKNHVNLMPPLKKGREKKINCESLKQTSRRSLCLVWLSSANRCAHTLHFSCFRNFFLPFLILYSF